MSLNNLDIKAHYKKLLVVVFGLFLSTQVFAIKDGMVDSTISPDVVKIDQAKYLGTPLDKSIVLLDENGNEFTLAIKWVNH